MKKQRMGLSLLLVVAMLATSCSSPNTGKGKVVEKDLDYNIINTNQSSDDNLTMKTGIFQEEKLLSLEKDEIIIHLEEKNENIIALVRTGQILELRTKNRDSNWTKEIFAKEAEESFYKKYPVEAYELEGTMSPNGTYYSVRMIYNTKGAELPDDYVLVSLAPGETEYNYRSLSEFIDTRSFDFFFVLPIYAPTDDRILLACEGIAEGKEEEGKYILILESNTLEKLEEIHTPSSSSIWSSNKTDFYIKNDEASLSFKAYSVVDGSENTKFNISTNHTKNDITYINGLSIKDDGDLYWIAHEGIFHLVSGGSLVEKIFSSKSMAFGEEGCSVLNFEKTSSGSFLVSTLNTTTKSKGLYEYKLTL